MKKINKYEIILASKSPRRQQLLRDMGIAFKVITKSVVETYPGNLINKQIAIHVCELKAQAFSSEDISENTLIITADTIVCLNDTVLGKPNDKEHAFEIIKSLSGEKHEVITGICLRSLMKIKSFSVSTDVYFKNLRDEEINYYINNFKPYDKAGAYGIQEWIGYIGVEKINGSYFNVMGLPTLELYEELIKF